MARDQADINVVVLTGAGVSAESGLQTFRDSNGLWEGFDPTEVATPEAWQRDPELVLRFYNERRRQVIAAQPNAAHRALRELEEYYKVTIITQNIDDLHERAGSEQVVHLHGEILKSQSSRNAQLVYPIVGSELSLGELCESGSQLRPNVVWFGEDVPLMDRAIQVVQAADILMIVGTSLVVYPAASLISFASPTAKVYAIDRVIPTVVRSHDHVDCRENLATIGVPEVVQELLHAAEASEKKRRSS